MTKPVINSFSAIAPLIIQQYERYLPTAFDESMSLVEKVNKVIQRLNELGEITNDIVDQWNSVMEWVMSDGLTESVNVKLDEMVADGTLDTIINQNIFNDLNNKIDTQGDLLNKTSKKVEEVKTITEKEFTDLCPKDVNGVVTDWKPGIEYAFNNYNYVEIPDGTYICLSPVIVTNPNYLEVIGHGMSILQFPNSSGIDINTNIIVRMEGFQVVGLNGIPGSLTTFGIQLSCNRYSTFRRMRIKGFGIGLDFQSNKFSMMFDSLLIELCRTGIIMQNANNNNMFLNCTIENNIVGVDCCYTSAGNSTTYNNQFKGGAIQFNSDYGMRVRKAEHIQIDLYFEGNGNAHIELVQSVANIESYLYGGNGVTGIYMVNAIKLIASFITLSGRSWAHTGSLITKDESSIARSVLRRQEATLTDSWTGVLEETLDASLKTKWKGSELIDSNWYRLDSASKISLKSTGAIEFTTGGEAIDFKDATLVSYGGRKVRWLSATPTTGTYNVGDIVYNTSPASGVYVGWVCTASGVPGTWKGFGLIQ